MVDKKTMTATELRTQLGEVPETTQVFVNGLPVTGASSHDGKIFLLTEAPKNGPTNEEGNPYGPTDDAGAPWSIPGAGVDLDADDINRPLTAEEQIVLDETERLGGVDKDDVL